jgi:hypothetical protein
MLRRLFSIGMLSRSHCRRFDIGRIDNGNDAIDLFDRTAQELGQLR